MFQVLLLGLRVIIGILPRVGGLGPRWSLILIPLGLTPILALRWIRRLPMRLWVTVISRRGTRTRLGTWGISLIRRRGVSSGGRLRWLRIWWIRWLLKKKTSRKH